MSWQHNSATRLFACGRARHVSRLPDCCALAAAAGLGLGGRLGLARGAAVEGWGWEGMVPPPRPGIGRKEDGLGAGLEAGMVAARFALSADVASSSANHMWDTTSSRVFK